MSDPDHSQPHEPVSEAGAASDGGAAAHGAPPVAAAGTATRSASVVSLQALLEQVHGAVATQVRDQNDRALAHLLAHYFPQDPQTGRVGPRTVQIPLPGPHGTPILRDVPLFSLVNHQDVAIEVVTLKIKAALAGANGHDGVTELMLDVGVGDDAARANAEIEIRFRGTSAPEGLARINNIILKQMGGEG
jgi:hypothetical protein